jgi:hypothetical protein
MRATGRKPVIKEEPMKSKTNVQTGRALVG